MGPEIAILGITAFGLMCAGLVCWGTHIDEKEEQRQQLARVVSSPGALPGEQLAVLPQVQVIPPVQMGFHNVSSASIVAPISFTSSSGLSEAGFIADDGSPVSAFDDVPVHSPPVLQTDEISLEEWAADLGETTAMADDESWSWNVGEGNGLIEDHSDFVPNELTSNAAWTESVYDAPLAEHSTVVWTTASPTSLPIAALPELKVGSQEETVLREVSATETYEGTGEEADGQSDLDVAERIVSEFASGSTRLSGKKRIRIRRGKRLASTEIDVQMAIPLAEDTAEVPIDS